MNCCRTTGAQCIVDNVVRWMNVWILQDLWMCLHDLDQQVVNIVLKITHVCILGQQLGSLFHHQPQQVLAHHINPDHCIS